MEILDFVSRHIDTLSRILVSSLVFVFCLHSLKATQRKELSSGEAAWLKIIACLSAANILVCIFLILRAR